MSSTITIHSVDEAGKHTITAFSDVTISYEMTDPYGMYLSPTWPGAVASATYEIHGANGYVVVEASTVEGAYLELLQSQAEKIAELERDKRLLQAEANRNSTTLDDIKDQIRIAIGDKEEPEEEGEGWEFLDGEEG